MKRYDQNFKDETLKLSDDIAVKKACEQLNLNYGTLSGRRKQRVKRNKTKKKSADEVLEENARLKKENDELKSANEILKDALFVFIRNRAEEKKFSARRMCTVLPVSERGLYK